MTPGELRLQMAERGFSHLFVDLDDTLLDGDSLPLFCRHLLGQHWHQARFHSRVSLPLLLAAGRLRPAESFKPSLARFFAGQHQQALHQLGESFSASELLSRLRPNLRALLEDARDAEIHVILATASLDLYCRPLADRLAVDSLLSTELEYQDGTCTGLLATPNCKGLGKLSRVKAFCGLHQVDPGRCAFLSDHESDIPCFELVGLPAVVRPTRKLRAFAETAGIAEVEV